MFLSDFGYRLHEFCWMAVGDGYHDCKIVFQSSEYIWGFVCMYL